MGAAGRRNWSRSGSRCGTELTALVVGTQDLNIDLAKLNFNAFNEGFDVTEVETGFKKLLRCQAKRARRLKRF